MQEGGGFRRKGPGAALGTGEFRRLALLRAALSPPQGTRAFLLLLLLLLGPCCCRPTWPGWCWVSAGGRREGAPARGWGHRRGARGDRAGAPQAGEGAVAPGVSPLGEVWGTKREMRGFYSSPTRCWWLGRQHSARLVLGKIYSKGARTWVVFKGPYGLGCLGNEKMGANRQKSKN